MVDDLEDLKEAEIELISNKEDKKIEFLTDQGSGTRVELKKGEEILSEFVVGKLASDFVSTYITQTDSSKTYSVEVNLSLFSRNDWYDKTIFFTEAGKINKIRFQYPDRQFEVEKIVTEAAEGEESTEVWEGVSPYKFKVSEEKINAILNIMVNLNAVQIPAQEFEVTGLEKNNIIVQATGEGVDNTIIVGDPSTSSGQGENEEGLYYALRIGSDNIYLITKEQRDTLDKNIRDLN